MGLVIDMCSRTMLWLVLASFSIREMMISDEANGRKADSAVFYSSNIIRAISCLSVMELILKITRVMTSYRVCSLWDSFLVRMHRQTVSTSLITSSVVTFIDH